VKLTELVYPRSELRKVKTQGSDEKELRSRKDGNDHNGGLSRLLGVEGGSEAALCLNVYGGNLRLRKENGEVSVAPGGGVGVSAHD